MAMAGVEVDDLGVVTNNNNAEIKMGNGSVMRHVDPSEINAKLEYTAQHLDEQPDSEIVKFFAGQSDQGFLISVGTDNVFIFKL